MPYSHHSHSGQFCPGHARNTLEEMVQTAIAKNMRLFAVTEHMPRHEVDFYPEEIEANANLQASIANQHAYYVEAVRLRQKYSNQIEILVGFEAEWIRPESLDLVRATLQDDVYDFFLGSVHHVHTKPIDFDQDGYEEARKIAGGTDERLFEDYFDSQFDMLQTLTPPVVSHFDLIRLKSDDPDGSFHHMAGVWNRILRNLDFIASYGGLLEVNFASLRKGMAEPYPKSEICEAFLTRSGRFCLSDDSHGVEQVGLNYHHMFPFLRKSGILELHYLERASDPVSDPIDPRFPLLTVVSIAIDRLENQLSS